MEEKIYRQCRTCMGTGVEQTFDGDGSPVEITCTACGGEGKREYLTVDMSDIYDDAQTLLGKNTDDNLVATYQIVESTKASEYNGLSSANKDAYRLIVSCGIVDLTDGTAIRTKLWNMFDENSETRANLITLLGE